MTAPLLHDLKRQVVTHPQDADARFRLGEALFGEGQHGAAATQLEKALALSPDHGNARRLLARAYAADDRLVAAERTLRDAVRQRPSDVALRETLAEVLERAGRIDDALLQLEEAVESEPADLERRLRLAGLYKRRGLGGPSRRHLEEAARRHPHDPRAVQDLRDLDAVAGDDVPDPERRGREFLLGRTRETLASPALRRDLTAAGLDGVTAALRTSDVAAAKRALLTAPAGPLADFVRAELSLAEGDAARAEKALERCLGASPEFGLGWERLAERRLLRGDAEGALAAAEKARSLDPARASACLARADALAALRRHDEADRAYAAAAEADPTGPASARLVAQRARRRRAEEEARPIGRIGALGWNPSGGLVSLLEAVAVPGNGQLHLTGNVGDVGQEAARVAFSCLKARAAELGIAPLVAHRDLHLHFSDTEFAKDGPSAGLALLLAAVSAYTCRALRPALAASGELTLHGAVKPVGGIHEKLVAAALFGSTRVLLPRRNLFDARELPPEVTRRLEVVHVDSVAEALAHAVLEDR
jgi:ATP-dependent Lon protease